MQVEVEKYQKEIESVLPLCEYNRIKTKYLDKSTLIGKKLLLIKKEEHRKYSEPYFVFWIAIITDEGRSLAISATQSKQHTAFYNSVQAGDVFTGLILTTGEQVQNGVVVSTQKVIQNANK